jgi:hypothetical protein
MGFIQSLVIIRQLVKVAMGHAHIHAQHTLSFLFGNENTPKKLTYIPSVCSVSGRKNVLLVK